MPDVDYLSVRGVSKRFDAGDRAVTAIEDVSFDVPRGAFVSILGPSGCGKSTLFNIIAGLLSPSGGDVLLEGASIVGRAGQVGYMLQKDLLLPWRTIEDNITLGQTLRGVKKRKARANAAALMDRCGLTGFEKKKPHQLSGGMRQRVMIAMALSCDPELLIADEPTTALDVTIQAQILELMGKLKEQFHTAIMLITHDMGVIAEMADEVMVMYAGEVVEYAPVTELFDHPRHPYTQGLLRSIPRLDQDAQELYTIEGTVPGLNEMPEGCRFAGRCPYATEHCRASAPPLREAAPGIKVRCWRCGEEA